jgi:hypothetical protein
VEGVEDEDEDALQLLVVKMGVELETGISSTFRWRMIARSKPSV